MKSDNLKKRIDSILANHTQTKDFGIEVKDNNGVITMIGKVSSRDVKELAEMLVKKQAGVSAVINELNVEEVKDTEEELVLPRPIPPSQAPVSNQG